MTPFALYISIQLIAWNATNRMTAFGTWNLHNRRPIVCIQISREPVIQEEYRMLTLSPDVRLAYELKTAPGTLYYECKRCGRRTKTYRKIKRHLRSCAR